jgi:hypothetical protein
MHRNFATREDDPQPKRGRASRDICNLLPRMLPRQRRGRRASGETLLLLWLFRRFRPSPARSLPQPLEHQRRGLIRRTPNLERRIIGYCAEHHGLGRKPRPERSSLPEVK